MFDKDRNNTNRETVLISIFEMLKGSSLLSQGLDLADIRTHASFHIQAPMYDILHRKYENDLEKKTVEKMR